MDIEAAISFMKEGHEGQTRRDGIRPYSVHPLDVFARVSAATNDGVMQIAALFHDLEEHIREGVVPSHPEYGIEAIAREFGAEVASLVIELTDVYTKEAYPDLNRKARKQKERERYATMSDRAKAIKLADIASNLSDDPVASSEDVGFMRMYISEKAKCLPYLKVPAQYHTLFDAAQQILIEKAKKFGARID